MKSIINYHVIDFTNIGDLFSAPTKYFTFPGYNVQQADIRTINDDFTDQYIIVGGGGLLYEPFLHSFKKLIASKANTKLIAWGIGQQIYSSSFTQQKLDNFGYCEYLTDFDLVGIRDFNHQYNWVPCPSCMHPAFDKKRDIKHEFVVFSHKKFQMKIAKFPNMTNNNQDIYEILDFLGSGETILTSSYHGAYWGTLLGRKVLSFPFSSKFYTLKHPPGIFPIQKWIQQKIKLSLWNKKLFEFRYENKFSCSLDNWQNYLKNCRVYPESLEENRQRNYWYYSEILNLLSNS
ncbi:polysaccharide pyruvyl transferase family protein [Umezakia ovalisporum]|uniref:Polysaccharide pyruvyl transferase family protein n=1 Tax=Umezakia ovalisporum FSS-43 TaxID=2740520 RepID=A0ABT6K7Q3_9CYAN|nr:polysaccharide pyruvyl transferase family protein [Umezakia ovalisporum]MDH6058344.1 polysaccharide pyruvyl transferase family protein [Umezakia ovalisporum FSS-43]MDH6071491.1 polysaccharide pyruvyl transferase family protein [Umezakia ovalisporum CobakiLakeA]MDH6073167.1 polysaccharide pyruvyl transferase family protein [Umezakia ovalisporum CS-1034]MDH6082797.1 polysaccharide pyruvyl transferase family protein [Umezakia ovalisporum FSS-44]MDH6094533.1 polysaccharide pyruvyl transferase f